MAWRVDFYEEGGKRPVEEFLNALPVKDRAKIAQHIQLLQEFGPLLDAPYTSQVEGKLRELRVRVGRTHYRILYYGDPQRRFVLLHALVKRTRKLPVQDVELAKRRMEKDLQAKQRRRRGGKGR